MANWQLQNAITVWSRIQVYILNQNFKSISSNEPMFWQAAASSCDRLFKYTIFFKTEFIGGHNILQDPRFLKHSICSHPVIMNENLEINLILELS